MTKRRFLSHLISFQVLFMVFLFSSAPVVAQGTPFTHRGISFHLPEGWTTNEIPANFEKEGS